MTKIMNDHNL